MLIPRIHPQNVLSLQITVQQVQQELHTMVCILAKSHFFLRDLCMSIIKGDIINMIFDGWVIVSGLNGYPWPLLVRKSQYGMVNIDLAVTFSLVNAIFHCIR